MGSQNGLAVPEMIWNSCDGMMVIDENRRVVAMNPAMEKITGRSTREVAGAAECGFLLSCRDPHGCHLAQQPWECPGLKAMSGHKPIQAAEYTIRTAGGKEAVMSSSYTPIQLPGRPAWALVVMRDVTARRRWERRLFFRSMTDPLTGLANRTALLKNVLSEIKRASRHSRTLAVAMADLDGFKRYNDTYGHLAGDKLLKIVAGLFQEGRRVPDLVARYGGDEFALLLPETDLAGALVVTERLRQRVKASAGASSPAPITVSMGVALFPGDGSTPQALLAQADKRLYEAKALGGNCVVRPT